MSPKIPAARRAETGGLDGRLAALAQQHKRALFDPFQELLTATPDMQAELGRLVTNLQVFFNKWTVELVVLLSQGEPRRFNELKDTLAGISGRTLSQRLKELEEQGLVARTVHDERPVRIDYALTPKGLDVAYLALPLVLYLWTQST